MNEERKEKEENALLL